MKTNIMQELNTAKDNIQLIGIALMRKQVINFPGEIGDKL